MDTGWGTVPVVSVRELVELKKTRRLADYDIITNLAAIELASKPAPSRSDLRWAASCSFRAEERAALMTSLGVRRSVAHWSRVIAREVEALQAADRSYWTPVITDLRRLAREGGLWREGTRVRDLEPRG